VQEEVHEVVLADGRDRVRRRRPVLVLVPDALGRRDRVRFADVDELALVELELDEPDMRQCAEGD
jgi:hypothetical protein